MRSRRATRLVAAIAIVFLAASGAGACLYPRTAAAAKECCRTRCGHDRGGSIRSCCCKAPAPDTTGEAASHAGPLGFAPPLVSVAGPSVVGAPAAVASVPQTSSGPPGFLQHRTLLL